MLVELLKKYYKDTEIDVELANILISNAESAFEAYTNALAANNQDIILRMVIEDYNKVGNEGIQSISFGNNTETVLEDYSAPLQKIIRKKKVVKCF